jgi:hypothetical protein
MDYDPYGNYIADPSKPDFGVNPPTKSSENLGRTTDIPVVNTIDNSVVSSNKMKPLPCMYGVFHMIISIFAIYLSFKCNKGVNLIDLLLAIFFPFFYIIYRLAVSENFCQ